jgi:hypothetical protein
MTSLPTTVWGAINRAKIDLRKFHSEQDAAKKEKLRSVAILSSANADKVVGSKPYARRWKNEVLFLNGYDDNNRFWEDDKEHWNLETVPSWTRGKCLKVQEPNYGFTTLLNGREAVYLGRPEIPSR